MKLSKLIHELQSLEKKNGDVDIYIHDQNGPMDFSVSRVMETEEEIFDWGFPSQHKYIVLVSEW